jgi:hypothetical protein
MIQRIHTRRLHVGVRIQILLRCHPGHETSFSSMLAVMQPVSSRAVKKIASSFFMALLLWFFRLLRLLQLLQLVDELKHLLKRLRCQIVQKLLCKLLRNNEVHKISSISS